MTPAGPRAQTPRGPAGQPHNGRKQMRNITRLAAAAITAAALALTPAIASAGVVTGATTQDVAGYQVAGNGLQAYNDMRATVTIPAGSTSNAAVYLQETVNTGGYTAELALVASAACPGERQVEAGAGTVTAPGPLALTSLGTADIGGTVACVPLGTPWYLEVHYSTLLRTVAFVTGASEFGNVNTLGQVSAGFREFRAPAIGAHYTALPALPDVATPQASFTRAGLTRLLDPTARRGGTDGRLTLASQSLTDVVATVSGGPVTVGNPAYLQPSGFGAGSGFTVTASS